MHIAFVAKTRKLVDAFEPFRISERSERGPAAGSGQAAALAAGAKDNGKPGPRPYHAEYYAAFVFDPDGHHRSGLSPRTAVEFR